MTPDGPDSKRMGQVLNQLATEGPTLRTQLIGAARRQSDADAGYATQQITAAVTRAQDEADQRRIRDRRRADHSEQVLRTLTRWPAT